MESFKVLGLMSGSSIDGIDMAYCNFTLDKNEWNYEIDASECIAYDKKWDKILRNVRVLSAEEFVAIDVELGKYFGSQINSFLIRKRLPLPDLVAIHGHTAFHNPNKGYTSQIGAGAAVSATCGTPVVSDLRLLDMSLGGQGAPIVPIGEKYLFKHYSAFLNIGGIANISIHKKQGVHAFDVCPANTLLNYLSRKKGRSFDKNGEMSRKGFLNKTLLKRLNTIPYYKIAIPKSLSTEYIYENFIPEIDDYLHNIEDCLKTVTYHIAEKVAQTLESQNIEKLLVSGGGALNGFLVETIQKFLLTVNVDVADNELIDFKEALVIAFFGLLRFLEKENVLKSVTGASSNSIGGALYLHK